tara:strand:- start:23799 stop:24029 length:231 start_codon:yes stop_codon:yes gene_type:complete
VHLFHDKVNHQDTIRARVDRAVKPDRERIKIRFNESMAAPYAAMLSMKGAKPAAAAVAMAERMKCRVLVIVAPIWL